MFFCSGNQHILNQVIDMVSENTVIVIIGTFQTSCFIDANLIHKKNLKLIGGREINGVSWEERQNFYDSIRLA